MSEEENPLETISDMQDKIDYMTELDLFIDDEQFMECMNLAVKMIAKPDVPQPKIAALCVQLEAWAVVFRSKYVAYMSFKKGTKDANARKNFYKEMYHGIDRLVDALKYLMR